MKKMESLLERSDTISNILPETFDTLLQESSFNGRFNTQDFRDILNYDQNEDNICKMERDSSGENWSNLKSDVNLATICKMERSSSGENWSSSDSDVNLAAKLNLDLGNLHASHTFFPDTSKKFHYGDKIVLIRDGDSNSAFANESLLVIDEEESTFEDTSIPALPAIPSLIPSLSLQPWNGILDFKIGVQASSFGNSKWAYSTSLKKLFLKPSDAVPIEIKVSSWVDAYINVTPVFISSQYKSNPVKRCHHHKAADDERNLPNADHIVQVDNPDALYKFDGVRHSVDIPLSVPAPGESARLLFVKCGCWNTCTGGPDRKPFCLVFTLFSRSGEEIGRQILNLKVCACPVRDCSYSEKKFNNKDASKKTPIKKKKITSGGKVTKKIKAEACEQSYEQIMVPLEIADEVKKYINRLIAEKYAKENNLALPFPQY